MIKDTGGVRIPKEDWDNLIILDGCRYDIFKNTYPSFEYLNGELSKKVSLGSGSPEFLTRNFSDRKYSDIVYTTSNPFVMKILNKSFHYTEHVWLEGWDEEHQTVLPQTMVEYSLRMLDNYPNKKHVFHFMQPHHPFIGKTRIKNDHGFVGAIAKSTDEEVPDVRLVWERLRAGELSVDEVWKAYEDNLRFVLKEIEEFVLSLEGKTIITSDHGNAFGERAKPFPTRVFGHGDRIRIPALVDVPWFEMNSRTRRDIRSGPTHNEANEQDIKNIEKKLEMLGYK